MLRRGMRSPPSTLRAICARTAFERTPAVPAVKDIRSDADVGARMRSYDVALIGIVLLAVGIAVLAAAPALGLGLPLAAALWSSAFGTFAVARRPGRR